MPITLEIVSDDPKTKTILETIFEYFHDVDERFSTYKDTSEISMINRGEIDTQQWSEEIRCVFDLAERTKSDTQGYFDIKKPDGTIDPSGIVKGYAIHTGAQMLRDNGCKDYFIDAGGDIASAGINSDGLPWRVGIRNPFKQDEIVKVIYPKGSGMATSGSYIRGAHIYDPHDPSRALDEIVSITVIAPDVLEADRFATAAFAMQRNGIQFIEHTSDLEGYMIDKDGTATMTSRFERFTSI